MNQKSLSVKKSSDGNDAPQPVNSSDAGKSRRIYLLRDLPPEVVAVAFAKTSRSPKAFDEIAEELTDESSAQFHEKWVVGYGHASVAEHAVLSIAIENVSRYATEVIEANRLASYTEKSSRYQIFSPDDYYVPEEIDVSPLAKEYRSAVRWMFENYLNVQSKLDAFLRESDCLPQREGESERGYAARVRAYALDRARFLLPISALANVGMTANARVLEHAIQKMVSHELSEIRQIGESLKEVCQGAVPTLVKYADYNPYLAPLQTRKATLDFLNILKSQNQALRLPSFIPYPTFLTRNSANAYQLSPKTGDKMLLKNPFGGLIASIFRSVRWNI